MITTIYDPNKGDGYVILNPVKPKLLEPLNKFNPEKQVRFICKECEMTIFVKSYDDIVDMEKTCNSCRRESKSGKRSELMKEVYLNKNAVVCNKCGNKEIRSKCVVGAKLKCPECDSFDVYETNPSPSKKIKQKQGV